MKHKDENQGYEFLSSFLKDQILAQKKKITKSSEKRGDTISNASKASKSSKYNNKLIEMASQEIKEYKQNRNSESQLDKLRGIQSAFMKV